MGQISQARVMQQPDTMCAWTRELGVLGPKGCIYPRCDEMVYGPLSATKELKQPVCRFKRLFRLRTPSINHLYHTTTLG